MKRKKPGFISFCLSIAFIGALILSVVGCASKTTIKLSSIEISPSNPPNITVGSSFQLKATGIYSDGSSLDITAKVTWESSNTGIIVAGIGQASGIEPGTAKVTAVLNGITSAPILFTVVSAFQGSANGVWSGQMTIGTASTSLSGIFSATINENGGVTGTISGTYSGTIIGQVTTNSNLNPTGNLIVGSTTYVTTWSGTVTLSGTSLNIQGTWTGSNGGSGVFSGSGTTSN